MPTRAPKRSSPLRVKPDELGLRTSYSRPRVSNGNAHAEVLFRTEQYYHDFPVDGFKNIDAARVWVLGLFRWYNNDHNPQRYLSVLLAELPNDTKIEYVDALLLRVVVAERYAAFPRP